jgi:cbb3-type cytochrome oxidase maturation protein
MTDFFYLIPIALVLGVGGLAAFLWSLRSDQYEDLDGAAERILFDEDTPLKSTAEERHSAGHRAVERSTEPRDNPLQVASRASSARRDRP